jgi:hypothetical protein
MTRQVAAQRALETIAHLGGKAVEFRNKWLTIQAFSSEFERRNQRKTLINTVSTCLSEEDALKLLDLYSEDIDYLRSNPVGNLSLAETHDNFYRNAQSDINEVGKTENSAAKSVGFLLCVIYQVRCNVEHGKKQLGTARSQKLFGISNKILNSIIELLLKEAEAA